MRRTWRLLLLPATVLALALALPACSDDDDPTDPGDGGPDEDTAAPSVVSVVPMGGSVGVAVDTPVLIYFDEAMDTTSDVGEVTLSSGPITDQIWTDDRTLSVSHDPWPEATRVEVTVGGGVTDEAGNPLTTPVTVAFWTTSSTLAFLESFPADGAGEVNRSASITVLFSEEMNQSSLTSGITVADDTKAQYEFSVEAGEGGLYTLDPDATFPASTLITVTIGTSVQSLGGEFLAEEVAFSFTTGTEADTTPPTITTFEPETGSTIPRDQGSITVFFDEPVDPATFQPTLMNGQFWWLTSQSEVLPLWNADNTSVTVALPAELPAGLNLEVGFAGYADANGVVQPAETVWTCTVAGDGDPYPVADGRQYAMLGTWSEGTIGDPTPDGSGDEERYFQFTARAGSDDWNLEEYLDSSYTAADYYDILAVDATSVRWLGFAEDFTGAKDLSEVFFSSVVTLVDLPLQIGNNWTSSTEVTIPGEGTVDATLTGQVVERGLLDFDELEGTQVYWTEAWRVDIAIVGSVDGDEIFSEERSLWLVEGIGLVRENSYEEDDEQNRWYESDTWYIPFFD